MSASVGWKCGFFGYVMGIAIPTGGYAEIV